ncbi:GNAT family N-acetyltransferase [Kibdelosporangium philippinense]|uniref:GNAT family N-acetyltransferase n=1 Tax=Kibdelosporangium philippinense TaxID=211113 RepID=A0ABS8ZTK1_9PSEU|nr:GNAT family N-acetyltransferase [Kibdelosporangium philippinense]MCE7010914.1 GNAT family N-acetyltransferase [Kibdelosporangium philippinense]
MMKVRDARSDELAGIRALLQAAYRQYAADMPTELFRRYLADLTELNRGTSLVASHNGTLVGTARFYPAGSVDELSLPADWAWCRAVAVHPEQRRAGIGHALLTDCIRRARETGAAALSLHTTSFMADGIRMYQQLGFERAPDWDITAAEHYGVGDFVALAYRLDLAA